MGTFLKRFMAHAAGCMILAAVPAAAIYGFRWAGGFILAGCWSIANLGLTVTLLETAVVRREGRKTLPILCMKFPGLYLLGFGVLAAHWFPTMSLLAGIGAVIAVFGIVSLWPKRT